MLVAAALAGAAGYFFAADRIRANDFNRSIQLIAQDNDATWCELANGQIVNANDGSKHCAIHMPKYQAPEPVE
ncbi:hypothetical protein [Roseovarius sp.]|uniref:hypothetical protein n=1 Tax=Roseovarius sp. TaxID=1486281 RepID=UPI000C5E9CB8|nr:hypothetical protein [Roseovarius sp.]MAZ20244.1 hypothetical protein [Roseovarius sp.]|tara:strand:- start:3277 stop:3495 length:219 start_codon:yes stop_codon:yes gene_type:complete